MTSSGVYLDQIIHLADHKIAASWLQAIGSGIGCNWFVGLALWLSYGAKDAAGKVLTIWFPVMILLPSGFSIVWQIVLSFRQRSSKATAHGWNSLRILFLSILGISSEVRYLYPALLCQLQTSLRSFE